MLWIWEQWLDTAEHQVQSKVVPYCPIENMNFDFDSATVKMTVWERVLKKIGQLVQFLGSSWYSCTVNNNAPLSIYGIINGKMVIWSKVLKLTVKIFSTSQWKEDMNYPNIKATHHTQDFPSEKCTQAPLLKRFQGWQVDFPQTRKLLLWMIIFLTKGHNMEQSWVKTDSRLEQGLL